MRRDIADLMRPLGRRATIMAPAKKIKAVGRISNIAMVYFLQLLWWIFFAIYRAITIIVLGTLDKKP
jgi:hypothetical protein